MYQLIFRGNFAWHCYLSYAHHLWRPDCAPGHCLADGTGRLSWPCTEMTRIFCCEKNCKPVSRILLPTGRGQLVLLSFICSRHYWRDVSAYPPSVSFQNRASSPQRWYTWHFSTQGLPPPGITDRSRGLLPHIFTLTVPMA